MSVEHNPIQLSFKSTKKSILRSTKSALLNERQGLLKSFVLNSIRGLFYLFAKINPKLLVLLEVEIKHMQGKGSGTESFISEAKMALDFLAMRNIHNPVVLDIGANIGKYSEAILELNSQARIFAFEPSTTARGKLEEKFTEDPRVSIVPLALSNFESIGTLWSDTAGSGLASLTKRKLDHFGLVFDISEQVRVSTLDSWIKTMQIVPDLIKMDVEGHELNILKGGVDALALTQVVQFEFGGCNIDTRTFFQDFWYLLTEAGFAIYRISKTKPILILKYSEEDEYFSTTNYLAVKN
jgi:FkbM family methyltransferase